MSYSSGNALVNGVLDAVDKCYPNLLDESNTALQVFNIKGALNTLFVQTLSKNSLNSESIGQANASKTGFQRYMVKTNGLSVSTVGNKSVIGSNVGNPISLETQVKPYASIEKVDAANLVMSSKALFPSRNASVFYGDPLDKNLFPGTGVNPLPDDEFCQRLRSSLIDVCHNLGSEPKVAMLVNGTTLNFTTAFTGDRGFWEGQLALSPTAYQNFPCVPGFSRVIVLICYGVGGTSFGGLVGCTYIAGPCDVDHYYVEQYFNNYNNVATAPGGSNSFIMKAKLVNKYGLSSLYDVNKTLCVGTKKAPGFALSAAQLDSACKNNVRSIRLNVNSGVVLFGAPSADISVIGTIVSEDVSLQSTSGKTIDVQVITCESSEFCWTIPKDWYIDYMHTGYDIFTPRVSNIKENVLKQWRALNYSHLTIRGVSQSYETGFTVSTLPEARAYAKARTKACKTNDWLDKLAIPDDKLTWRDVDRIEKSKRGRNLWMNTSDVVVFSGATSEYDKAKTVSYTKDKSGVITRADSIGSGVIDLKNEDDMALAIEDFFFNSLATFNGVTKADLSLSVDEEVALNDSSLNLTTAPAIDQTRKVVGFGSWIDSSGQADVTYLSEEQKYRLHITNSLYFDKMMSPLKKVIESFGYHTLVKFV